MSRPLRLRTPEGAWYSNYEGYKRRQNRDEYFDTHADNERERKRKELELYYRSVNANNHSSASPRPNGEQQQTTSGEMITEYEKSGGMGGRPPLFDRSSYSSNDNNYGRRPSRGNEYLGERGVDPKAIKWQTNRNLPLGGQPRSEWEREWDPSSFNGVTPQRRYDAETAANANSYNAVPPAGSPSVQRKVPIWERERVAGPEEGHGYRNSSEYVGVRGGGPPGRQGAVAGLWNGGQRSEWEREWQPAEVSPRRAAEPRHPSPPPPQPLPASPPARRGKEEAAGFFGAKGRSEWEREWQPAGGDLSPRKGGGGAGGGTGSYDPSFLQPDSPRRGGGAELGPGQGERYAGTDLADYDYMKTMFSKGLDPRLADNDYMQTMFSKGTDPKPSEADKLKGRTHGAFMFIRFPLGRGENVHNVEKWCVQAKPQNMGGQFIGIARRVFDYGFVKEPQEGCAVFQFNSIKNAQIFFDSDHRLKQPDFPPPQGHADIFSIEMDEIPPNLKVYDTFLYSEITLNDGLSDASLAQYEVAFKEPFAKLLQDPNFDCKPYVCYSTLPEVDRKMHRKHFFGPKVIVAVHLFRGPTELEELMKDKRYSYLRSIHNAMAQERCSIFTVGRSACP